MMTAMRVILPMYLSSRKKLPLLTSVNPILVKVAHLVQSVTVLKDTNVLAHLATVESTAKTTSTSVQKKMADVHTSAPTEKEAMPARVQTPS